MKNSRGSASLLVTDQDAVKRHTWRLNYKLPLWLTADDAMENTTPRGVNRVMVERTLLLEPLRRPRDDRQRDSG